MGKLDGRVAFITGAARGQGRAHAIRLAEEGAGIIAIDICQQLDSVGYPMGTEYELDETVALVEKAGGMIYARQADVRNYAELQEALHEGEEAVGPVDIVVANAAIGALNGEARPSEWQDTIDINLTGVYNTVRAALPGMIERGNGGAIVLISSTAGLTGISTKTPGALAYTAAKHGLVGLVRAYANELGPYNIRINSVHPCGVNTPMVANESIGAFLEGQIGNFANCIPIDFVEPVEISHAVAWLVSDEARYVTGVALPVDAGFTVKK